MHVFLLSFHAEDLGFRHDDEEGQIYSEYGYIIADCYETVLETARKHWPSKEIAFIRRQDDPGEEVIVADGYGNG